MIRPVGSDELGRPGRACEAVTSTTNRGELLSTPLRAIRLPAAQAIPALRRVWDAGEAAIPLSLDAPPEQLRRTLEMTRPASLTELVGGRERTIHLDDPVAVADDVVLVVATSGSTGAIKGVELTGDALQTSSEASIARLGCRTGDRWLVALPLHHIAGLQSVLRAWLCRSEPVLVDGSDTAAIARAEAEYVSLVPAQLSRLLDEGADLTRFRAILLGGARPDRAVLAQARAGGATIVESYGMTETAGGCVYDGVPLEDVRVDVRGDGRIRIRGPVLFRGYRSIPLVGGRTAAPFDEHGWFVTGDLGEWRDGRLQIRGRADDIIISGGENVPAASVADAIRTHRSVADAAVLGRDHPAWGQVVVAVVVAADRARPPELSEIRSHLRTVHPPAWSPRDLVVVDALPRDGLGKVSFDALRSMIAAS